MPSYIIVDGSLADSVIEYSSLLDLYNEGLGYVEKINQYAINNKSVEEDEDDNDEVEFEEGLYVEIANTPQYLVNVPDKEFEAITNLAVYILTFSNEFDVLLKKFLDNLIKAFGLDLKESTIIKMKKRALKVISIISILSNIFNLIEIQFEFKKYLLETILEIVKILNNTEILLPVIPTIEAWILEEKKYSQESVQSSKDLLFNFADLIYEIDELKAIDLLIFTNNNLTLTQPDLSIIFNKAISSKKFIDFSPLLKISGLDDGSKTIIKNYFTQPPTEFQTSILSTIPSDTKPIIVKKNQLFYLAKLANETPSLSFAQISSSLNITEDQVEIFLVDAIKSRVVEGKISQSNKSFNVLRVNLIVKDIGPEDWKEVKDILLTWRQNLKTIKSLVYQASKRKHH